MNGKTGNYLDKKSIGLDKRSIHAPGPGLRRLHDTSFVQILLRSVAGEKSDLSCAVKEINLFTQNEGILNHGTA